MDLQIDWAAFGLVFGVALLAGVGLAGFFSLGLRLLAIGSADDPAADAKHDAVAYSDERPPIATLGALLCFAVCVAGVLYGLYLIIPQFHP